MGGLENPLETMVLAVLAMLDISAMLGMLVALVKLNSHFRTVPKWLPKSRYLIIF